MPHGLGLHERITSVQHNMKHNAGFHFYFVELELAFKGMQAACD